MNYHFVQPLCFTAETTVYDESNAHSFYIKGFYKGFSGFLLKTLNFQINFKLYDYDGLEVVVEQQAVKKSGITGKWDVTVSKVGQEPIHYLIDNKTKLKTDIKIEFHRDDRVMILHTVLLDRKVYFYDKESNQVLAEALMPRVHLKNMRFTIKEPSIEAWEVAMLYFLLLKWQ